MFDKQLELVNDEGGVSTHVVPFTEQTLITLEFGLESVYMQLAAVAVNPAQV